MRSPSWWRSHNAPAARMLSPVSYLYAAAQSVRTLFARPEDNTCPIICIGNAISGGAGKTPLALAIARILKRADYHVAGVSRGYGGTYQGVILVDADEHDAKIVGDESLLLSAVMPVFLCRRRSTAIQAAYAIDPDVIIADDGMQNPTFKKDILILAENPEYTPDNTRLFPAGPYREHITSARARADMIVRIYYEAEASEAFSRTEDGTPVFSFFMRPHVDEHDRSMPYIAFAGIGNPQKFFATLTTHGFMLKAQREFPDHHRFSDADCSELVTLAEQHEALLITTEKDRVRLPLAMRGRVRYLSADAVLPEAAERTFYEILSEAIPKRAPILRTIEADS